MSEAWIIGLVTVVVGAVLGAYLNPILQGWMSGNPKLYVAAKVSRFSLPQSIRDIAEKIRYNRNLDQALSDSQRLQFYNVSRYEEFCQIELKNIGRVTVEDINIKFDVTNGLILVEELGGAVYSEGNAAHIERIAVGQSVKIVFWGTYGLSSFWKSPISVHANKIGRVGIKYISPEYISRKNYVVRKWWVNLVCLVLWAGVVVPTLIDIFIYFYKWWSAK